MLVAEGGGLAEEDEVALEAGVPGGGRKLARVVGGRMGHALGRIGHEL